MTDKYQNKYRIASTRLQNWDYAWNAAYFITICTHNREWFFGEIINQKMILSEIGQMAEKYWYEIPQHFPFVKLDAFVVMPNHIHGIIIIDKKINNNIVGDNNVETQNFASNGDNVIDNNTVVGDTVVGGDNTVDDNDTVVGDNNVETQNFASLQPPQPQPPQPKNQFGPQSQNLASIIRGYKIGVTKNAKKINPLWQWQSRYYDHIIRDDKSYERIKNYIINNPVKWNDDKFNK